MSKDEDEGNPRELVFRSVEALAKHLNIKGRRVRRLKQQGRLNYTTQAVIIRVDEINEYLVRQAAYRTIPAPFIPTSKKKGQND